MQRYVNGRDNVRRLLAWHKKPRRGFRKPRFQNPCRGFAKPCRALSPEQSRPQGQSLLKKWECAYLHCVLLFALLL